MHGINWLLWAAVLFTQNISFTYVSRARSSGSLLRHLKASIFSNGIWIFSNMIMLGPMFDYLTGKHGIPAQVGTGVEYTIACVGGSLFAHYWALRTEQGKNAVGYNKKYAQIPIEQWEITKQLAENWLANQEKFKELLSFSAIVRTPYAVDFFKNLKDGSDAGKRVPLCDEATLLELEQLQRVRSLAENAYDVTIGLIPDSGIRAVKVAGETVTTGIPRS